jgi:glycosyltransferase involved in cell wall biosynthesis
VDLTRYRPGLDVTRLRSELGLSGQGPIILSPRYQVDEDLYNLDIVVDAFADVLKSLPDAVCLQMYDPDRVRGIERLRGLSASRGLGDSYRLIPGVSNSSMPLYYNLADVAVSVPSSDGFPVTILEASACGCPLIVSNLPYCTEWFVQRENGVIVGLRDKEALASAIIEVCTTPQLRQRLASAGRRKAEATASYERCMDDLEALYMKLLGNPEAP